MYFSAERINNMTVQEYNAAREEIYKELWEGPETYSEYRDLWILTGEEHYLEGMIENVTA